MKLTITKTKKIDYSIRYAPEFDPKYHSTKPMTAKQFVTAYDTECRRDRYQAVYVHAFYKGQEIDIEPQDIFNLAWNRIKSITVEVG